VGTGTGETVCGPSRTNDAIAYEVVVRSREPGDITCICPGATHRGICKHIGKVMLKLETDPPQVNEQLERDITDLYR
jgi:uncharacterized Zn finger protein